jgi:hypothetical protein
MRASWKVNRSLGDHGPWVIQLAVTHGNCRGWSFQPPLPQHRNFKTRKAAEVIKRELPRPLVSHGIVIDGVTFTGIAI